MSFTTTPPPLTATVTLLDRAERECTARAESATSRLDDLTIWHLDAHLVRIAAETLRSATGAPMPQLPPWQPGAGLDPLELLLAARDHLEDVPDELENMQLFLGRLRTTDALSAIRSHYE